MNGRFLRLAIFVSTFAFITAVIPDAQSHAQAQAVVAFSTGVLQNDGTVLYSVLLASGVQAISDLTITSVIPEKALTTTPVVMPVDAILVASPADGSVQWQVKFLDAATVVGPFTYRVIFPADYKNPPASATATAIWAEPNAGSIKADQSFGTLAPLAETGDVRIAPVGMVDAQGNARPLSVGDTGIVLYAGDQAVPSPVTLHFTRMPITDQTAPQSRPETWWCALVKLESDSILNLTKPILIGLPTRQILTPGMTVQLLARNADSEPWQLLDTAQGMTISALGNLAYVMATGKIPVFLAIGVNVKDRQKSALPIAVVSNATGFAGVANVANFSGTGGFSGRVH